MLEDIIRLAKNTTPFQPFSVRMADGQVYPVPSTDHIFLVPGGNRIIVADDRGVTASLPVLFITGVIAGEAAVEMGVGSEQP